MLPAQVRTNLDCQRLTRMDLDHRQRWNVRTMAIHIRG